MHACQLVVGTHTHLFRYRYCMFAHLYDMCQVFPPLLFAHLRGALRAKFSRHCFCAQRLPRQPAHIASGTAPAVKKRNLAQCNMNLHGQGKEHANLVLSKAGVLRVLKMILALNEAKCRWRPLPPASLILKSLALPPVQQPVPFPLETSQAFFSLAQATISCLPRNPLGFLWLAYKAQSCLQSLETYLL